MIYPNEFKRDNYNYRLIKIYTYLALYENQYGFKECFRLSDFGKEAYYYDDTRGD